MLIPNIQGLQGVQGLQGLQNQLSELQNRLPQPAQGGGLTQELGAVGGIRSGGPTGFAETLNEAINRVDNAQQVANRNIEAYVAGEMDDLHEVMISMNTAKATFNLMTEVRNRVLESYQELMRLQV